jgi:hypothetical protein
MSPRVAARLVQAVGRARAAPTFRRRRGRHHRADTRDTNHVPDQPCAGVRGGPGAASIAPPTRAPDPRLRNHLGASGQSNPVLQRHWIHGHLVHVTVDGLQVADERPDGNAILTQAGISSAARIPIGVQINVSLNDLLLSHAWTLLAVQPSRHGARVGPNRACARRVLALEDIARARFEEQY